MNIFYVLKLMIITRIHENAQRESVSKEPNKKSGILKIGGNPLIPIVVPLLLCLSVTITFQRCKGKSQLSNDLGIRYGLSKIFLSLRVKEYLAESAPQLPTVYRHRQPSESIVKSKVPNGKEQKAPNHEGKS